MRTLSRSALVDLSLDITWKKDAIRHEERYFIDHLNCWRDIFPGSPLENLLDQDIGQPITLSVAPGQLVPEYRESKILRLPRSRLSANLTENPIVFGRFYPQGMISGHADIFKGNSAPFRCIGEDQQSITADLNHPMAKIPFRLTIRVDGQSNKTEERGGSCTDWIDLALSGPGMQARQNFQPTNFFTNTFFQRKDPGPDTEFYATDRFVHHIDDRARQNLAALYQNFIQPGDTVLDLMAGWESHIPDTIKPLSLHGIGLNKNELVHNTALTAHTIQDLNTHPALAFNDHVFDSAVCSLSVEYLTDPLAVFKEVARVLKPGGPFIVSFSNRWFPEKAIGVWENLHDFERLGLVTDYFLDAERYDAISTISSRGYPRPCDDDYFPQLRLSDPLYAVIGHARNG
jgi:SAM-dependent methyltransferase